MKNSIKEDEMEEESIFGAIKDDWLQGWGYTVGTAEAKQAWSEKLAHDLRVSKIPNPNKSHGRLYDLPGYESPATGKWIEGTVARRNDLAASGCVAYEDGMKEEQQRRFAKEDVALDKKVDEIVEKTIYEMPAAKREQLATELEHSDLEVARI